jgi:hypothetical protein
LESADTANNGIRHISYTACSLHTIRLLARIETVKLALGNDALANGAFIVMIEDGCCAMGPICQSLSRFLDNIMEKVYLPISLVR